MTTPPIGRRWAAIPFILYALAALVYTAILISGRKASDLGTYPDLLEISGSFVVFFYAFYFVGWKWRQRPALRMTISVFCVFAVFVLLGAFDVMGFEGPSIGAHGLTVPNILYWFWPGVKLEMGLERIAARFAPPPTLNESSISLRGGMPQPDGSLILYGQTGDFNSYSLAARLDPQGNLDPEFKPVPIAWFVTEMRSQPDGTALVEYVEPGRDGVHFDEVSATGSLRPIALDFFRGELGKEQENIEMKTAVFPSLLLRDYMNVIRIQPDGKLDKPFNEQASKTIGNLEFGGVRRVAVDPQGLIVVALSHALVRLDADAHVAPPGPTKYDPKRRNFDPDAIAIDPHNGAIYVTSGTEGASSTALPWLVRFDTTLHEDAAFSANASTLAEGAAAVHVLGFRADDGIVVSLSQASAGSRILILDKSGQLVRELHLAGRFIAQK
ncbi:MAG TPA: hypothetical protein VGL53_15260 [Bryobacteraceae bacterium]